MNKKYLISIPLLKTGAVDKKLTFTVNTLLDPFYISESALLSLFLDEEDYQTYSPKAREIIFNASLKTDAFMYGKLQSFPKEHVLTLKRELALCLSMNSFGRHFMKSFSESIQRTKSYAEFTVSTSIKNNPNLLKGMVESSDQCLEEIKQEIKSLDMVANGLGLTNMKGINNLGNPFTWRVWAHNNLPYKSQEIFASDKIWYNGNIYKDGNNVSTTGIEDRGRATRSSIYDH